ncbi:MAG TPA: hypothetical protein VFU02_02815 [Polyangiaceae bacterium]|nr:hypothetical protein [Polyangiaceae bacterium]
MVQGNEHVELPLDHGVTGSRVPRGLGHGLLCGAMLEPGQPRFEFVNSLLFQRGLGPGGSKLVLEAAVGLSWHASDEHAWQSQRGDASNHAVAEAHHWSVAVPAAGAGRPPSE